MNDTAATQMNKSEGSKWVSDEELVICLESGDPRFELFAEKYMKFIVLGLDSGVAQSLCEFYKSGATLRDSFEEYWIKMLRNYYPEDIVCLLEDLKRMDLDEVKNLTEHCLKMMKQRGLKPKQCNEQPSTRRRKTQWKSLQSYEKSKGGESKLKAKRLKVAPVNEKQLCKKDLASSDQGKVYEGIVLTASRPQAQIGKISRLSKPSQSTNQSKAVQLSKFHKPRYDGKSASNGENSTIKEPPKSAPEGKAMQMSESHPDASFPKARNDGKSTSNKENSTIKQPPKSAPEGKTVPLSESRPGAIFHKPGNDGKSACNKENSTIKEPPKSAPEGKAVPLSESRPGAIFHKLGNDGKSACNKENSTIKEPPKSAPEGKAVPLSESRPDAIFHITRNDGKSASIKENSTIKEPPKSALERKVESDTNFQADNLRPKVKHTYTRLAQPLGDALCNLHRVGKLPADQPLDDIVLMYLCQLSVSKALQLLEAYKAQEHVQDRVENASVYFMDFAFNKENSTIKGPPKSAPEGKVGRGANFQADSLRPKVKHAYTKLAQPLGDALCNLHRVGKLPADRPLDDIVLMYLCQLSVC